MTSKKQSTAPATEPKTINKKGGKRFDRTSAKLIGEVFRQKRDRIGLSLMEVARDAGISSVSLHRIEQGEHFPTMTLFIVLCETFAMSPAEVFTAAGF